MKKSGPWELRGWGSEAWEQKAAGCVENVEDLNLELYLSAVFYYICVAWEST